MESTAKNNLERKVEDLIIIAEKAELAFNAKTELVHAKDEIIDNLKMLLQNCTDKSETTISSVPGMQESVLCLKDIAVNGIILNGFLVWADIQGRTTPQNIWKEIAIKHFTKEEITDAKELLWDVAMEDIFGRKVNRKGESKSSSEIDDICNALTILSEKEVVP